MGKISFRRYAIFSAVVSTICGFFHALPYLGGIPSQITLLSAARGLASLKKLPGYNPASLADLLNGWLWNTGGATLLTAGQVLAVFAGWTLGAMVALAVMLAIVQFLNTIRIRRLLIGSTVFLLLATCVPSLWNALAKRREKISDLTLIAPLELITTARSSDKTPLFATPTGQGYLLLFAPALGDGSPPDKMAALSLNPPKWREALRTDRWQAALLAGPIAEYRPLLDHLITSPDWHLAAVTNQGYLFLRGPGQPAKSLEADTFHLNSTLETALYLAQIAERYDAIRRSKEARACMDRARELAPNNPTVLAHAATYAAAHKRWQDAIAYSNKALAVAPDFAQAKIVQALALIEIGEINRAQSLVDQVLIQSPEDLYTLFLSARISKAQSDYAREAETLEKIIALSNRDGLPVMNYQIYLGQAYSRLGQAKDALINYRAVLATGQLNKEQAAEIQNSIDTIESRENP